MKKLAQVEKMQQQERAKILKTRDKPLVDDTTET